MAFGVSPLPQYRRIQETPPHWQASSAPISDFLVRIWAKVLPSLARPFAASPNPCPSSSTEITPAYDLEEETPPAVQFGEPAATSLPGAVVMQVDPQTLPPLQLPLPTPPGDLQPLIARRPAGSRYFQECQDFSPPLVEREPEFRLFNEAQRRLLSMDPNHKLQEAKQANYELLSKFRFGSEDEAPNRREELWQSPSALSREEIDRILRNRR